MPDEASGVKDVLLPDRGRQCHLLATARSERREHDHKEGIASLQSALEGAIVQAA